MNKTQIRQVKKAIRRHLRTHNLRLAIYSYDTIKNEANNYVICKAYDITGNKDTSYGVHCYYPYLDITMYHYYEGTLYQTTEH